MYLFVEIKTNIARDVAMLLVEAITDILQLPRELFEILVVFGLNNEVMVLKLVEVKCVLDHVRVF